MAHFLHCLAPIPFRGPCNTLGYLFICPLNLWLFCYMYSWAESSVWATFLPFPPPLSNGHIYTCPCCTSLHAQKLFSPYISTCAIEVSTSMKIFLLCCVSRRLFKLLKTLKVYYSLLCNYTFIVRAPIGNSILSLNAEDMSK